MKNRFIIGDMAKIHNISTQTLRYYDKIGLLKPKSIDENNGYRYYTIDQFEELDTIKYLKFLGMSLGDIKQHFQNKDIESAIKLLQNQEELTEKKINELKAIKDKISDRINCIKECRNVKKYDIIYVKYIEERYIAYECINDSNSIVDFEMSLKKLQNLFENNYMMVTTEIGVSISLDNLRKNNFVTYDGVYLLIDDKINHKSIRNISKGRYACIYHKGPYKESHKSYEKLLDYIRNNKYDMIGDSLEIGLIDCSITLNEDEYITEIQIPIK